MGVSRKAATATAVLLAAAIAAYWWLLTPPRATKYSVGMTPREIGAFTPGRYHASGKGKDGRTYYFGLMLPRDEEKVAHFTGWLGFIHRGDSLSWYSDLDLVDGKVVRVQTTSQWDW